MKPQLAHSDKLFDPEYRREVLNEHDIVVNQHCNVCTAETGSSYGGSTIK